jgi:hypothetical protein
MAKAWPKSCKATTVCPACGRPKRVGHTFCHPCKRRLPFKIRHALHRPPLSSDYIAAVADGMRRLAASGEGAG